MMPIKLINHKVLLAGGLRILGSALALLLVFQFVSIQQVWEVGQRLPTYAWLAAFVLFLFGHALAAVKWALMIDARQPFGRVFRAHLAGLGANLALPGVAGGDVVRAGLLYRAVPNKGRLAAGSLIDRLIDTLALLVIMLAGGWALVWDAATIGGLLWRIIALALPVAALFFLSARLAWFWPQALGEGASKPVLLAAKLANACVSLAHQPGRLIACFALSLLIQGMFVAIVAQLATHVGIAIPEAGWAYGWAGGKIVAILPISLGGLGVREATMAAMLQPYGAEPQHTVAVGLLWQTILYAGGILGLLVQTFTKRSERRAPTAEATPRENAG